MISLAQLRWLPAQIDYLLSFQGEHKVKGVFACWDMNAVKLVLLLQMMSSRCPLMY